MAVHANPRLCTHERAFTEDCRHARSVNVLCHVHVFTMLLTMSHLFPLMVSCIV
jgi:hypothetical protein